MLKETENIWFKEKFDKFVHPIFILAIISPVVAYFAFFAIALQNEMTLRELDLLFKDIFISTSVVFTITLFTIFFGKYFVDYSQFYLEQRLKELDGNLINLKLKNKIARHFSQKETLSRLKLKWWLIKMKHLEKLKI